jgi:hypothetical protein
LIPSKNSKIISKIRILLAIIVVINVKGIQDNKGEKQLMRGNEEG